MAVMEKRFEGHIFLKHIRERHAKTATRQRNAIGGTSYSQYMRRRIPKMNINTKTVIEYNGIIVLLYMMLGFICYGIGNQSSLLSPISICFFWFFFIQTANHTKATIKVAMPRV